IDGLTAPHSANIDPTNQLLLVPCLKEDRIRLFDLSQEGQLTPHAQEVVSTAAGAGPRHMAFHPNHQFAYCVNELDGTVDVFAMGERGGKYTLVQTLDAMPADFTGTRWAADIHITPNGRFLYVSDRTASILTIFSVAADGSSIAVVGYHPTEEQPRGFNIDHSGRFVISAGQKSGHVEVCAIDQERGVLTMLGRYPVGKGPMWRGIAQAMEVNIEANHRTARAFVDLNAFHVQRMDGELITMAFTLRRCRTAITCLAEVGAGLHGTGWQPRHTGTGTLRQFTHLSRNIGHDPVPPARAGRGIGIVHRHHKAFGAL
uniref:6-phosphogluconolactonase n=1 Tax=Anopheles maculatus TaxID=74869 RepID=A0A182S5X9_9DIPT